MAATLPDQQSAEGGLKMAAKHTPWPWRVEGRRGPGYIISAGVNTEGDGPAEYVGVIDPMFHVAGEGSDRHAANARLIASAPALLDALKEVHGACLYAEDDGVIGVTSEPTIDSDLFDRICAAIRQAEGGE